MMTIKKFLYLLFIYYNLAIVHAQNLTPIKTFNDKPFAEGAIFSCYIHDINSDKTICELNNEIMLTPASLMKLVTTAGALDILGSDFRYKTTISYDGTIKEGVLHGNIYIKGSGDPTLGSSHFAPEPKEFINEWISAIKQLGIRNITGAVIADESIFDSEGLSLKWVYEDMGSYYGAGSYGLSVFDNMYKLQLRSGNPGSKPKIISCNPEKAVTTFHNYLKSAQVRSDSTYILGAPFSKERYLYGVVPANKESITLKGDIPDPALFIAQYLERELKKNGISTDKAASCYRILKEQGKWSSNKKTEIISTYSPTLAEIVRVTNHASHNLYADAIIKTVGLSYKAQKGEVISSFNKGINIIKEYWKSKGLDVSELVMYDGSGLAPTDKITTAFLGKLLTIMYKDKKYGKIFIESLPAAGISGSVRNFMKGTELQGKAKLKSGSMSGVKSYAGYIDKGGKTYSVVFLINQYKGKSSEMTKQMGNLLNNIF